MTSNDNVQITVICEGKTELNFVKYVLNAFFINQKIHFLPIDMMGKVSTDRIIAYAKRAKTKIVTTLVDYYGYKNPDKLAREELLDRLKSSVDNSFFIPYVQMHEIEALWFSDIDKIVEKMNADKNQKKSLELIIQKYPNPETINNSINTAPSKRLEKIFIGYDKPRDGINIAKEINLDTIRAKCPIFNGWIDTLIKTADVLRK